MRPDDYGPDDLTEATTVRPRGPADDIADANRRHWLDRARDIADPRPPARRGRTVHDRRATVYIAGQVVPHRPGPFAHRRPTVVHRAERPSPTSEPAPVLAPEPRPAAEPPTVHDVFTFASRGHEPDPCPGTDRAVRDVSDRSALERGHGGRAAVFDEDDHRPRRNLVRLFLRRVFGDRLSARPWWWARACRSCRTEWPCGTLVDHLHRRHPDVTVRSTTARDADLDRLARP